MAFDARVFRILIASPSDVASEREMAVNVIQEWNDLYSGERNIVLLPLRWETHSAPEFGRRPQEVINRQVVDQADMLVGIFWTRIGSPTGVSDSGTLEEIDRIAQKGNLIMLYFSTARQNPDDIDTKQLEALREFKRKTFPRALVENYSNLVEFRDKLARHIEIQIKQLASEVTSGGESEKTSRADIELEFADLSTNGRAGVAMKADTNMIAINNLDKIKDYQPVEEGGKQFSIPSNKNYYRDAVVYYANQLAYIPIRFWFKNIASIGLRDIYVEFRIASRSGSNIDVQSYAQISSPPRINYLMSFDRPSVHIIKQSGSAWLSQIEFNALQPQREYSPAFTLAICPEDSGEVVVTAKIYADIFAVPLEKELIINCNVIEQTVEAVEMLRQSLDFIKSRQAS